MNQAITDLDVLLRSMTPELHEGAYAYVCVAHDFDVQHVPFVGLMRESEGITLIVLEQDAVRLGLNILFRTAWISLTVHSDLQAVGLTAAFASALGAEQISCNVVAGAYHDHIFVPFEQANAAMATLQKLQKG